MDGRLPARPNLTGNQQSTPEEAGAIAPASSDRLRGGRCRCCHRLLIHTVER
ncbi:hypothetical protein [Moorena sp. SIO4G3]|uniref:hypothetical protein n=1 Tax=Moorena sp. SIO4G3 TaxID=2607821 RepID=UPI00142B4F56|nr:hypothetical protein [Moorena sp. SIO4G3]NEO82563.1 hypothetical protein [Moorena sp. SIO4G3]